MASSAENGGLFSVNFESSHQECLLKNGGENQIHGIWQRSDGVLFMVDRGDEKLKVFKGESKEANYSSCRFREKRSNQLQSALTMIQTQFM